MNQYVIRFADISDIEMIMEYIDEYWKRGHILAVDRKMFEWQYTESDKLNMILGFNEDNILQGILGYIPYGEAEEKDICLALWKANKGNGYLGIELLSYLLDNVPHRTIFCNGINLKTTKSIYEWFGFNVGKLKQWYRLLPSTEYKIAEIVNYKIPMIEDIDAFSFVKANTFEELICNISGSMFDKEEYPYKSREYIEKRYFNHPKYDYLAYKILDKDNIANSAIVFRIQEYNNSCVLRVIDFWGRKDDIYYITGKIESIASDFNAEYIDMYEYGLDDKLMKKAGWLEVGMNENIIPNYFAPYTLCNVDINFCSMSEKVVIFKGDGDQDRPN